MIELYCIKCHERMYYIPQCMNCAKTAQYQASVAKFRQIIIDDPWREYTPEMQEKAQSFVREKFDKKIGAMLMAAYLGVDYAAMRDEEYRHKLRMLDPDKGESMYDAMLKEHYSQEQAYNAVVYVINGRAKIKHGWDDIIVEVGEAFAQLAPIVQDICTWIDDATQEHVPTNRHERRAAKHKKKAQKEPWKERL